MLKKLFTAAALIASTAAFAQDAPPANWFNLDAMTDGVQGMSVEKAYSTALKNRPAQTVIVAVIDSGVDPMHEDLKDVMWVNEKEAKGKPGVDDDNNGYVDDLHGWNFLGGKDGRSVNQQTVEMTRELARLNKKFEGKKPSEIPGDQKKEYAYYIKVLDRYTEKKAEDESQLKIVTKLVDDLADAQGLIKKELGKDGYDAADLAKLSKTKDKKLAKAVFIAQSMLDNGYSMDDLVDAKKSLSNLVNFSYNLDFDPRSDIIKDNPEDINDSHYGNSDVRGPDALHGTHVAGIIAAERNNGKGINGVADHVRIMSVRTVPDGDENDKDVALAIRYAVDNGAQVINMSFGKSFSPHKQWVDDAVRYAAKHDVLLVHAAGNDASDNDHGNNFPSDTYEKRGGLFKPKKAENWLEIGALSWKKGEDRVADFSNYGKKNVDLFSPGVAIHSTIPDNKYKDEQGTSMASPAAAGVAAMLRSYFPTLTAVQVKKILMESTAPVTGKVKKPGSDELVELKDLCVTGGVVNGKSFA